MRKKNKQKKVIVIFSVALVFLFSVGYASFSSEFLISGKGKIINQSIEIEKTNDLKSLVTTSGDGLYTDPVEIGRYVYRGASPNNYIWLDLNGDTLKTDDEIYRIVAIEENNTIKLVAQNSIGDIAWDVFGNRRVTGYCMYTNCNIWGSSTTTLDSLENNVTVMPREVGNSSTYALPSNEASLNTYLNNTFLNSIDSNLQDKIVTHAYNVGLLARISGQTLETDIAQESAYKWKGKIALINATDYVRASTNSACVSIYEYYNTANCYNDSATHNYLFRSGGEWTLSPYSASYSNYAWNETTDGKLIANAAGGSTLKVFPSFYLSPDITLSGSGTDIDPYTIAS